MTVVRYPAAYIRINHDHGRDPVIRTIQQHAIAALTRGQGWPEPMVYLDQDWPGLITGGGTALAALTAAIGAGRHDAVLLVGPRAIQGCPSHLLRKLLFSCSRHGVSVDYVMPAEQPEWPDRPTELGMAK